MTSPLSEGLHEALLTRELQGALSRETTLLPDLGRVDPEDQLHVLTRHLAAAAMRRLEAVRDPAKRLELANELLAHIADDSQFVLDPVEELHALRPAPQPGVLLRYTERPRTPLNDAALLTNAHGEPSLAAELRAELDSADSVDPLCAFVMWHGLRLLEKQLTTLKEVGVPLRVMTTTYIGGTERRALDRLVREFGADVRVQYDAARTRLHAKAWIFHRNTGYDTAYVGSSNLTTSAMLEGVEWNVRLSNAATPALMQKFRYLRNTAGPQVPTPLLAASAAAWRDEDHVAANRATYAERFAVAKRILGNRTGFRMPDGGFFLWLDVGNGEEMALRLWREEGIRVLPGAYMGRETVPGKTQSNPGFRYVRVALVSDLVTISAALERLAEKLGGDR